MRYNRETVTCFVSTLAHNVKQDRLVKNLMYEALYSFDTLTQALPLHATLYANPLKFRGEIL